MDATTPINPGDRCRNGATVLLAAPPNRDGEQVILADVRDLAGHPFVTWRAWRAENGSIECVSGDYLRDAVDAAESFARRARPQTEWSGSPDPDDPDNYWIDDATGQRRKAPNGEIVEPCPELATQGIFTGPCVLDKEHDGPHQVG